MEDNMRFGFTPEGIVVVNRENIDQLTNMPHAPNPNFVGCSHNGVDYIVLDLQYPIYGKVNVMHYTKGTLPMPVLIPYELLPNLVLITAGVLSRNFIIKSETAAIREMTDTRALEILESMSGPQNDKVQLLFKVAKRSMETLEGSGELRGTICIEPTIESLQNAINIMGRIQMYDQEIMPFQQRSFQSHIYFNIITMVMIGKAILWGPIMMTPESLTKSMTMGLLCTLFCDEHGVRTVKGFGGARPNEVFYHHYTTTVKQIPESKDKIKNQINSYEPWYSSYGFGDKERIDFCISTLMRGARRANPETITIQPEKVSASILELLEKTTIQDGFYPDESYLALINLFEMFKCDLNPEGVENLINC